MSLELTQERSAAAGALDGEAAVATAETATDPFTTVGAAAADAARADPAGRWQRTLTVGAAGRDLGRLIGVLSEPITAVRRAALVAHVGFLVEQLRAGTDPGSLPVALSRLRHEARLWARDPRRRPAMLAAASAAAALLSPVHDGAGRDEPAPPAGTGGRPSVRLRELPARRPTTLAYRYFWLLDGLPPLQADRVMQRYSRPARWVLRNGLSGGYNRRAYLMWTGGGSGPAV